MLFTNTFAKAHPTNQPPLSPKRAPAYPAPASHPLTWLHCKTSPYQKKKKLYTHSFPGPISMPVTKAKGRETVGWHTLPWKAGQWERPLPLRREHFVLAEQIPVRQLRGGARSPRSDRLRRGREGGEDRGEPAAVKGGKCIEIWAGMGGFHTHSDSGESLVTLVLQTSPRPAGSSWLPRAPGCILHSRAPPNCHQHPAALAETLSPIV